MIRQVLDCVLLVVICIVRLKRHTIVAHPVCGVFAKSAVFLSWDLARMTSPVNIYGVFIDELPRSFFYW